MHTTYHIKSLDELAEHFQLMANQLRDAPVRSIRDRLHNEAVITTLEQVAMTIRSTVLDP
jgi:hypothetical protein